MILQQTLSSDLKVFNENRLMWRGNSTTFRVVALRARYFIPSNIPKDVAINSVINGIPEGKKQGNSRSCPFDIGWENGGEYQGPKPNHKGIYL